MAILENSARPKPDESRPFVLRADSIGFKTLCKDDVETFTGWFQNLEFVSYLTARGVPHTRENDEEWYSKKGKNSDTSVQFGIFTLKDHKHIGNCGLFQFDCHGTAVFGIGIGDPSAWGKGYGAQASRLMCEYGFFFLNLYNIRLYVYGFNERAIKAYLKAGFREVGRIRGGIVFGGQRFDNIVMDITRDDVDLSRMRKLVPLIG